MSDLTKAGPSVLDMEEIMEYLDIAGGFVKDTQIANADKGNKIEKIAGIDSDKLAKCYDPEAKEEDELQSPHNTVLNAQRLNGLKASDYMTTERGNELVEDIKNSTTTYNDEIANLRDEVYQLREELAKTGVTTGYKPYSGFYDMFRDKQPVHEEKEIATVKFDVDSQHPTSIKIETEKRDYFFVGDEIVVKSMIDGSERRAKILEMPGSDTLVLDTNMDGIMADKAKIFKSHGHIINGTFTFGEITAERPSDKELYTCLDDDTYSRNTIINRSHSGLAYTFRIPQLLQKNYLSKVDVQLQKHGNPGALMCYIIDERDMERWKNAEQAVGLNDVSSENYEYTKFHFFAKSQPLSIEVDNDMHRCAFSFYDPTAGELEKVSKEDLTDLEIKELSDDERQALENNGFIMKRNQASYPLMRQTDTVNHPVRYCMIIEATQADANNYYYIKLLDNSERGDLQKNNITYIYDEVENTSEEMPFADGSAIANADLYYGVTLLEATTEAFTPYEYGIYTARFRTDEPIEINHARLAMRIAREGMYNVSTPTGNLSDRAAVTVRSKRLEDVDGFAGITGNNIVIGTEIRKVVSQSNDTLTIEKGAFVEPDDIVYPIGYRVYLNARLRKWNPEKCMMEYSNGKRFELPISHVMSDLYKVSPKISDRLIFENTLLKPVAQTIRDVQKAEDADAYKFNDFEIQICWDKTCKIIAGNFAGRIHDLVLSFEKAVFQ